MDGRVPTFCFNVPGRTPGDVASRLAERDVAVWHGNYYAVEVMRHLGLPDGAVAAVIVTSGSALARSAATPTLKGTVGPGFTISLTRNGKRVKALKAGRYKFVIADKAAIHNFTLEQKSGGKFEKDVTTVPFVGEKTLTLTLKKGKWKYYRSPHEPSMFGFFTVT